MTDNDPADVGRVPKRLRGKHPAADYVAPQAISRMPVRSLPDWSHWHDQQPQQPLPESSSISTDTQQLLQQLQRKGESAAAIEQVDISGGALTKPWEDDLDLCGNPVDPAAASVPDDWRQETANLCFSAHLSSSSRDACQAGRKLAFGDARELGLFAVEQQLESSILEVDLGQAKLELLCSDRVDHERFLA